MKLLMLSIKKITSSLRILIFLILLNFLFTISIVNAINSKISSRNNNHFSISNPLSPVTHSIKSRAVTITINHKKPPQNHENGKNGKGNRKENGEGNVKGKEHGGKNNTTNNENNSKPKNQQKVTTTSAGTPAGTPAVNTSSGSPVTPAPPPVQTDIPLTMPPSMTHYQLMHYMDVDPDLRVHSAISYFDGPIILRLSRTEIQGNQCYEPILYLRLIYNDATVKHINVTYKFPYYNFCLYGEKKDLIRIFPLNKELDKGLNYGYFLVSYFVSELSQEIGLIMDWDGNLHSQLVLSSSVKITSTDLSQLGKAVVSVNPQYGFIWVNHIQNTLLWTNYSSPDNNGQVVVQGVTKTAVIFEGHKVEVFPTLDGGYGYIMVGKNPNPTTLTPPELSITPLWMVNVIFIRPDTGETTQPSLIYSSQSLANDMNIMLCDNSYDSPGLVCVISVQANVTYYVKINFLSSGSTRGPARLFINNTGLLIDNIYSLYNGYYVVSTKSNTQQLTDYIYDNQGNYYNKLNLPNTIANSAIPQGVFPNNTFWVFSDGNVSEQGWTMTTVSNLTIQSDKGYDNLRVNTTSPMIGDIISIGTTSLSITFYQPVLLSVGNISIYQHNYATNQLILRQSYSTNTPFTTLSQDKRTLTLGVLNSAFNLPGSNYTVVIDDNTIKDLSFEEPLLGISFDVWKFSTESKSQTHETNVQNALVRMTKEASYNFKDLSDAKKSDFLQSLSSELAQCVPITKSRLQPYNNFQWDPDVNSKQILLKFKILPGSEQEPSADIIINTLDNMIQYSEISPISDSLYAASLDNSYGFIHKKSVWDIYGFTLFAVGAILLLLGILAMLSYKKENDGNSFVSFKILLIALDFVLDFIFVVVHSRDVYTLYYPSLLTFIVPLVFNMMITFFILIKNLSSSKRFYKWYRTYHNVAAIFTFCSIIDVESLTMINSKLAGLAAFNAPISFTTEKWILFASILNFFIEDTPQLIIQIIYILLSVNYQIIPFLNLISASLLWICAFFGRSYHVFLYFQNSHDQTSDNESTTPYANLNNGGGDNNGNDGNNGNNGNMNEALDNDTEVRSVEYVLTPPLEEISNTTIRPPSWWLDVGSEYPQYLHQNSNSTMPNNGVSGDGNNGYNNSRKTSKSKVTGDGDNISYIDGKQNDDKSDYQILERRSSLYNGPFSDENEIGIAGPSTVYNRGFSSAPYEIIGNEYGNIGGNKSNKRINRTSQEI